MFNYVQLGSFSIDRSYLIQFYILSSFLALFTLRKEIL